MNTSRVGIALVLSATTLLVGVPAGAAEETLAAADPLPTNVLFIGNSHTERNGGMDWLIGNMVRAEDTPREYHGTVRAANGVTLEYHYENGAPEAIRAGDYDTVVLQGYLPGIESRSFTPFLEYARLLDEEASRAGARTVFYMTWPQGTTEWPSLDDLVAAHRQIGEELGAPVAPVGVAFAMVQEERPELALLGEDEIHATWEGSYLAALTLYATLFERSPEGLDYAFGVDPDDAAFLQSVAWRAVTDWQEGA